MYRQTLNMQAEATINISTVCTTFRTKLVVN